MKLRAACLAIVSLLVFACGPSAKEKTIRTTLVSVNAAREGFLEYDDKWQDAIIEHASSEEEGQRRLAEYREKRSHVVEAFVTAYLTIATAALDPSDLHVADVLAAAARLYATYKDLTGHEPRTK